MAINSSDNVAHGDVVAQLNFFVPPADGAKPFNYTDTPPEGQPQRNFTTAPHDVLIQDIRGREAEFSAIPASLDRNAFVVLQNQPPSAEREFVDDESIRRNYYPEVEALLLKSVPGSNKVVIFDHTVRRGSDSSKSDAADARRPVLTVHIDQTGKAAALRVRRHLPEAEAEAALKHSRYRIINVWRPISAGPVASFPLAIASSASVRDADVVGIEHRYPEAKGYIGETAGIHHHPDQQWYYLSAMTGDERLLLECFDSASYDPASGVQGGRVPHTAFEHARTPAGAPSRESIEVRALVFGQ